MFVAVGPILVLRISVGPREGKSKQHESKRGELGQLAFSKHFLEAHAPPDQIEQTLQARKQAHKQTKTHQHTRLKPSRMVAAREKGQLGPIEPHCPVPSARDSARQRSACATGEHLQNITIYHPFLAGTEGNREKKKHTQIYIYIYRI